MLRWFRNRRMGEEGRRRLAMALARAEQTLVETHVANVLDVHAAVSEDLSLRNVLDLYLDTIGVEEPRASIVARQVLAQGERARSRGLRRTRPRGERV